MKNPPDRAPATEHAAIGIVCETPRTSLPNSRSLTAARRSRSSLRRSSSCGRFPAASFCETKRSICSCGLEKLTW